MARAHAIVAITVLGVFVLGSARGSAAAEADDERLLERVMLLYPASRRAIKSVECNYLLQVHEYRRQCRYAADSGKLWHASVGLTPDGGPAMPHEVAWNGQRSFGRGRYKLLGVGSQRADIKAACKTPEEVLGAHIDQALGLTPNPARKCEFAGASEVEYEGQPCVELRFNAVWNGGTMTILHGQDVGYWPVHALLTHPDGSTFYELRRVQYAKFESDGNLVYFPLRTESGVLGDKSMDPTQTMSLTTCVVDKASLKVNQPIPPERFVLTPWPCEEVHDVDAKTVTPPADPNWSPVGRVSFPWDGWAPLAEKFETSQAYVGGRDAQGRMAIGPNAEPERSRFWTSWPMIVSLLALAGAGLLAYRRRRMASA